jgi:quaternary ammonium compound-resistance protein SugE
MKYWIILLVAAALEIVWAGGLKSTVGFTRLGPSLIVLAAMIASMYLLAQAARGLPIGTAYAVWTGLGAVGVAVVGMVLYKEPASLARIACIGLIIAGIVGLKVFTRPT